MPTVNTARGAVVPSDGLPTFRYSRALSLERRPGYILLTVDPGAQHRWQFRYALRHRGSTATVLEEDASVIDVPVQRVAVEISNGFQQYLDDLGASDTVVGISSFNGVYPWLSGLHQRRAAGTLVQIDGGDAINIERVIDLQIDLMLSDFAGGGGSLWQVLRRDVSGIALAPRLERHPLASAEWIKLLGLLFDRQEEAEAQFLRIETRYRDLASRVAAVRGGRPRVLPMRMGADTWSDRDVIRQIVTDAGGQPVPGTSEVRRYFYEYPYEVILDRGADADVWPFARFSMTTLAGIVRDDARLAAFRPVREGHVYHPNGRMQPRLVDPYFSAIYLYPDAVLADLVKILHPDVLPDHQLVYFRAIEGAVH